MLPALTAAIALVAGGLAFAAPRPEGLPVPVQQVLAVVLAMVTLVMFWSAVRERERVRLGAAPAATRDRLGPLGVSVLWLGYFLPDPVVGAVTLLGVLIVSTGFALNLRARRAARG